MAVDFKSRSAAHEFKIWTEVVESREGQSV